MKAHLGHPSDDVAILSEIQNGRLCSNRFRIAHSQVLMRYECCEVFPRRLQF